jgi:hypothetical protein
MGQKNQAILTHPKLSHEILDSKGDFLDLYFHHVEVTCGTRLDTRIIQRHISIG